MESLESHFILIMSHWSSGLPVCFRSQGTRVQIPWGYLCETGILLLALSRYNNKITVNSYCCFQTKISKLELWRLFLKPGGSHWSHDDSPPSSHGGSLGTKETHLGSTKAIPGNVVRTSTKATEAQPEPWMLDL